MPFEPPSGARSPIARAAPAVVAIEPTVVENAFAVTSASPATTCGSATDSAESTNRLTEITTSALA